MLAASVIAPRKAMVNHATLPCGKGIIEIQRVRTDEHREQVSRLLRKMYEHKGYTPVQAPESDVGVASFLAIDQQTRDVLGTISVGFERRGGLSIERLYAQEVNLIRSQGRQPCEMIRLAIDRRVQSRKLVLALFNAAFVHGYYDQGANELLIEVNPSHVRFYQNQFHFQVFGPERFNPVVAAPSVLLKLDMDYGAKMAYCDGWRSNHAAERSLLRSVCPS